MTQQSLRHCDFCDQYVDPDSPLGTAEAYISYQDDREGGVEEVNICLECATAELDSPDEPGVLTCDVCGHTGYSGAGRCGGTTDDPIYRNATVMNWNVRIAGLKGYAKACEDCTPIKSRDMLDERPKRRTVSYGETA